MAQSTNSILENSNIRYDRMRKSFTRLGMLAGPIIVLGFVIGAWSLDWIQRAAVGAEWPWLHFALGAVLCLPIGFLAGLISGRSQSGFISLLTWMAATALLAFIASHVPFEIASWAVGRLDPRFAGLEIFPFVPSAIARQWLVIAICIPLGAITGGLVTMAVDSLYSARSLLPKTGLLLLCSGMLAVGGLVSDLTNNTPLRAPLFATNIMLDAAAENWGRKLTNEQIRGFRLGAVRALGDTVLSPRQLGVGIYEPESMDSMRARINFDGRWVTCYTIADQPTFCQFSDPFYGDFLACLWSKPDTNCKVRVSETALDWLNENRGVDLPQVQVIAQRGAYTLLAVETADGSTAVCRFTEYPALALETCANQDSLQVIPLPTPTPRTSPANVGGPASAVPAGLQQTVLDPSLLEGLSNLPRYTLNLNIQPDGLQFAGEMTLVYTNTTPLALDEMVFRLLPNAGQSFGPGSLQTSTILVNDTPATPEAATDPSILRLPLATALLPEQTLTIRMAFSGIVPKDFGGEDTSAYGIYNFTQRVLSLSSWYPILAVFENGAWRMDAITPIGDAVYSEMAFYRVAITTPRHWEVATTGILVTEQLTEDGSLRRSYLSGPMRDFYLAASPDFSRLSEEVDGVIVNTYALPGSRVGNQAALSVAVSSLEIFNERFGKYPYTELDVIQIPMRSAGGVEFPGIILIESERYDRPEDVTFLTTVAHEVAHQWWYNVVGSDIFNEPWLDEALTTYSSALFWETRYGRQAYQEMANYWESRLQDVRDSGKDDRITGTLQHFMNTEPRLYGAIVYSKGALFFAALRTEIGDEAFFKALQTYYQRYSFKIARAENLLSCFEEAAGRDLDAVFTEWLYQP